MVRKYKFEIGDKVGYSYKGVKYVGEVVSLENCPEYYLVKFDESFEGHDGGGSVSDYYDETKSSWGCCAYDLSLHTETVEDVAEEEVKPVDYSFLEDFGSELEGFKIGEVVLVDDVKYVLTGIDYGTSIVRVCDTSVRLKDMSIAPHCPCGSISDNGGWFDTDELTKITEEFSLLNDPHEMLTFGDIDAVQEEVEPISITAGVIGPVRNVEQAGEESVNFGAKFDQDKLDWSLLPLDLIEGVVEVLSFGAEKYEREGWMTVPNAEQRYYAALMRHLASHQSGDLIDEDSGLPHLYHVMTNVMFLIHFMKEKN